MTMRFLVIALAFLFVSCDSSTKSMTDYDESVETSAPAVSPERGTVETAAATETMPSFEFEDEKGNVTSLTDLKGKKVFINLWATWCPPCRVEMPSIERLYQKVNKDDVVFIMLSLDENFDMAKKYVKENKLNLPVHYPASGLPQMFNTGSVPNTFIFDEKGKLIKKNIGMDDYDTDFYVQLLQK